MHEFLVSIKLAFKNLQSNWGRTLLSLLGIVLGVMSVIVVLSVGNGVKGYVVGQVESFGTDIMQIEVKVPKTDKTSSQNAAGQTAGTQITTLKVKDAEKIAKIPNVGAWYAATMTQKVVSFGNKNKQMILMGTTAGVVDVDDQVQTTEGLMFTDDDDRSQKQVAVLGSGAKNTFFGNSTAVGQDIKIDNKSYQIIGVLKERGAAGIFNFDDAIYLPLETVQKRILGVDYIRFAIFRIRDMAKLDATIDEANNIMRDQHKIKKPDDDDFAVNSIVEIKAILDKVFSSINLLLLALTSISLIVGGVGIMNVMYVAVAERTFEIGLRKAVGAKNRDIMRQFVWEAVFLTVFGGILGIILGSAISFAVSYVISQFGFEIALKITWDSVLIGFGFSALAGIIFGIYPAKKASQLTPMDALRKE